MKTKEEKAVYLRNYKIEHGEQIAENAHRYYIANKDEHNKRSRQWAIDNKDKVNARRRERRRQKTPVIYLDQRVDSKCKNLIDSYGEICVKCNCCGCLDHDSMYTSRLRVVRRHLKEEIAKLTDPYCQTAFQQKNIRAGIRYFKKAIAYDERKVKEYKTYARIQSNKP